MFGDDTAITPTIGEILMVTVTVLMAVVVAAYAFGMGTPKSAPKSVISAVSVDIAEDYVKLTHQGGDNINLFDTKVTAEQKNEKIIWTRANTSSGVLFKPGDSLYIYTGAAKKGIYLNGNAGTGQNLSAVLDSGSVDLVSGTGVKVALIDIPSSLAIVTNINS